MNEELRDQIERLGLGPSQYSQDAALRMTEDPLGGVWTTVLSNRKDLYAAPAVFSCLAEKTMEGRILDGRTDWLVHSDSFAPYLNDLGSRVRYHDGQNEGFSYIVASQYFYSINHEQLIVNPEFVMLLGLLRADDGNYYSVDECGSRELVIDFTEGDVRVRTKLLLRYISAKQMLYVQFIDSRTASDEACPVGEKDIVDEAHGRTDCYSYDLQYQATKNRDYLFSIMHARSIVRPKPIESCGIYPFDDVDEVFPEFIIKELPDGSFERFTCNPDELGTYFDKEIVAPLYLTPVYFKPDVLDKYRGMLNFEVSEYRLSCGSQWSVEIDHVDPKRVMVYLGDLGRDLPESERRHFLEYEMSPDGQSISEETFARDFLCAWVEAEAPVAVLERRRRELDKSWLRAFGVSLYRPFHQGEADVEQLIRIPSSDSREEFDTVILNLTKYLVDYIEEAQFKDVEVSGSINKLEKRLADKGIEADLSPLRDLQNIRSACTAHSRGRNYDRLRNTVLTGDCARDISDLVKRLSTMLEVLSASLSN